jgi:peptidoglycan/LPS O-acetylase OafA/YrhL
VVGQSLIALLSGCMLVWGTRTSVSAPSRVRSLFSRGVLPDLGRYSYGIYLLHYPIHRLLESRVQPWVNSADDRWLLPRLAGYTCLVLLLAYLSARVTWRVLEEPFLQLKERWTPSGHADASSPVPATSAPTQASL